MSCGFMFMVVWELCCILMYVGVCGVCYIVYVGCRYVCIVWVYVYGCICCVGVLYKCMLNCAVCGW